MNSNLVYSVLARGAFSLFSIAYLWLFGRILSVGDFALFALFDSLRLFFCNVPSWGSSQAMIRRVNQRDCVADSLAVGLLIQLFWLGVAIPLLGVAIKIMDASSADKVDAPVFGITVLYFFSYYLYLMTKSLFLSLRDTRNIFILETTVLTIFAAVGCNVVFGKHKLVFADTVNILSVCFAAATLLCLLFSFRRLAVLRECSRRGISAELRQQLNYIKHSIPNNLAANLVGIIDSSLILITLGPLATASYKACKIFNSGFVVFGEAFNLAMFPEISAYNVENKEEAQKVLRKYLKTALLITVPVALVVSLGGPEVLRIIYKGKYSQVAGVNPLVMSVGVWGVVFVINRLYSIYIGAIGFPDVLLKSTVASALVSIVLLYCCSYQFGLFGVGIGAVLSVLLNSYFLSFFSKGSGLWESAKPAPDSVGAA